MAEHTKLVEQAQQGDLLAFSRLFELFGPMAHTLAYSWLRDSDLAQDVVQEAFFEAYTKFAQLKNPAAFPGWLRRIVIKHCDRHTRRSELMIDQSIDPDEKAEPGSPLSEIISNQEFDSLRRAIETLPDNVRLVVALHYLAGSSGQQVADFLEIPLSTVKKRLRVARDKLRTYDMSKVEREVPGLSELPNEVALFVAIREGNTETVKQLLTDDPKLANIEQNWDRKLVYDGILPFAEQATPLISAIQANQIDIVNLLLAHGADANNTCGCETQEPPLWTACLLNRADHVKTLLKAGANPNVKSAAGNTPLHIASMRGFTHLVKLLLQYRADPNVKDQASEAIWPLTVGSEHKAGWKPADWAAKNEHTDIVELLGGSTNSPGILGAKNKTDNVVETGIKAIDFFAPISRGSLIRVPFKAGVGMVVLLAELTQIFFSKTDGAAVWTGFTQPPFDLQDVEEDMLEFGFREQAEVVLESYQLDDERRRAVFNAGIERLLHLRQEGKNVLAVILSAQGFESDIESYLKQLTESTSEGSITTLVVTPFKDEEQSWSVVKAPYTTQLSLDRERAKRNLYPTLEPRLTLSNNETSLTERHLKLRNQVMQLYHKVGDINCIMEVEGASAECLREVTNLLAQPFHVTEAFRGTPGVSVPLETLLDEIEAILVKFEL